MKYLYAYNDTADWGKQLVTAAREIGLPSKLFRYAFQVPAREGTIAFLRMRNSPRCRRHNKRLAEKLAGRPGVQLIPSIRECRLYDDKISQAREFAEWMPETWHITSREQAHAVLADLTFPFVSKSSEGSAASNVRLIKDAALAQQEIEGAFSRRGLGRHHGLRQSGYLLWQRFVPDNPNDWRVDLIAGRYAYVVKRHNRKDVPFASGGGCVEGINELTPQLEGILDQALAFTRARRFNLAALDIVTDFAASRHLILEASCSWGRSDLSSQIFENIDNCWRPTGYTSREMFDLMAHAIANGEFA